MRDHLRLAVAYWHSFRGTGSEANGDHDYEERRWRHLDSCQFKTVLVSRVPIMRCPEHGSQTVAVPWAEKYDRFSRLFERLAIDGGGHIG
jgi:transposase